MQRVRRPSEKEALFLRSGLIIRNHLSGRQYRVGKQIGTGGFGVVYRVFQLPGAKSFLGECCLKIAADLTAWHREAYFGDLFRNVAGVIRVHESFAWMPRGRDQKPLYCLVNEFAEGGDVAQYLQNRREPWQEPHARREIIRLLRTVMLLHDAGAVHRDITPTNVFVTSNEVLKLGDFGIASHGIGKHEVPADVFAPRFAPAGMVGAQKAIWRPADDVYHLGQLFSMLLWGCAESKLTTHDVKKLSCSPEAKAVIQRCIGQRRKRFPNAAKMLTALEEQEARVTNRPIVRSLKGKRVVFTGRMSIRRTDAEQLVRKLGGIVDGKVSHQTNIVILGTRSPLWKADTKGQKLLDTDREDELGNQISVIREPEFRLITGTGARSC